MSFEVITMEGDKLTLEHIKGCKYYDVPLNEIVGSRWSEVLQRFVSVYARELFQVELHFEIKEIKGERVYKTTEVLRSNGYCELTRKYRATYED